MAKARRRGGRLQAAYAALGRRRPKFLGRSKSGNHKIRSDWFRQRSAWPYREPPIERLLAERLRAGATLNPAPGTSQWEPIGPTNVGGRVTCLVYHPEDSNRLWIGAAGGGVWASGDGGVTWRPLWSKEASLNVGALAIDREHPETIYCATGEANLSADSYAGVGLYRTVDGGQSWLLLAPASVTGIPTRVGALAIDPADRLHLRLGGLGYSQDFRNGLFVSRDGGATWIRDPKLLRDLNYWCHAIVFHPHDAGIFFVALTAQGSANGIWRTTDGGATWHQLTNGLPPAASMGRTSLAISAADPRIVYAQAADAAGDGVLGIFRSNDGGNTWSDVSAAHFGGERQMSYNNTIVVHPTDPDHVLCGGVDVHLSTDGGRRWRKVTRWDKQPGDPGYAHADQHALAMPSDVPGRVYACNDGGLDVSQDGGITWSNRSQGLAITMFYDLDVAQSNRLVFGGGCQDNGTQITDAGLAGGFFDITGGDGGWIIIDPQDARHIFASIYNLNIYRRRGNGEWADISPPAGNAEKQAIWMCFLEVGPTNSRTLFAGSSRVWRTKNDGNTWQAVSPSLDDSPITAIAVAPGDEKRVYIGTENGAFFRSTDGGNSWSANLAGPLPGRAITRIDARPDDANTAVACVANFGHSHVFLSTDGGFTWSDIDRQRLPDVPFHVVVIPPDAPTTIYAGCDAGVFVSHDLGGTWMNFTRNLPNVMIVDLVYRDADRTLSAATYGRSLWRIRVDR